MYVFTFAGFITTVYSSTNIKNDPSSYLKHIGLTFSNNGKCHSFERCCKSHRNNEKIRGKLEFTFHRTALKRKLEFTFHRTALKSSSVERKL